MCVVSMIIDHFGDSWYEKLQKEHQKQIYTNYPKISPITREEIEEFRKLLERAREYDKRNNEPDCEMESKKERIRTLADELGVKVDFI